MYHDAELQDHGQPSLESSPSAVEVTRALEPHFEVLRVEDVGPCMFAVTAQRR